MLNLDDLNKIEHRRAMELMYNSEQYRELERQLQINNSRIADLKPEIRLAAIYLLKFGGEFVLDDLWRMFYRRKPPTIQEFLTDEYLPETNQILYPQWRKDITELFDVGSTFFEWSIGGAIGGGKCHKRDHGIMMADGTTKKVQDITIGDQVMGPDSKPRTVLQTTVGHGQLYEVVTKGGGSFVVNAEHVCRIERERKIRVAADGKTQFYSDYEEINMTLQQVMDSSIRVKKHYLRFIKSPVEFESKPHSTDPYLFGTKFGNGDFTELPDEYKFDSSSNRLNLLAGIIDSFAASFSSGYYAIICKSESVANDIKWLALSLGFRCSVNITEGSNRHLVSISGFLSRIPIRSSYKQPSHKLVSETPWSYNIKSIKPHSVDNWYGFELDGDHLYLDENFFIHHNTTAAIVAHLYNLIRVACLVNPHATLGSAPNKTLIMSMFTLTLPKARKALIEPFLAQMKECSKIFELVDDRREMKAGFPSFRNSDVIPFFDNNSEIILPNSVNVMLGSQVSHALSFDMFGAFLDEAEFRDKSGGPEKALEVWNSLRTRVTSRFLGSRFTFASLVSSARYSTGVMATYVKSIDPNSKKEKYSSFPIWEIKSFDAYKEGHFYVLRGNSAHPSQVLNAEYDSIEAGDYTTPEGCELLKVPKVYYREFTHDLVNSIKDLAGMQLVTANYPFPRVDNIVDPNLVPEFEIIAPLGEGIPLLTKLPKELFVDTPNGKRFARYGSALRYVHIDLAEVNIGGLSIVHKERCGDQTYYVADLTCEITSPTRIDISSIFQLLIDLKEICGVPFHTISADQYQSADGRQRLEVMEVAKVIKHLSVDSSLGPISDLARLVIEGKFKVGLCPNLQDQMRQLQVDVSASSKKVKRGEAGKDQFDSICGAVTNAISNIYDYPEAVYIMDNHNKAFSDKMEQAFSGLKLL